MRAQRASGLGNLRTVERPEEIALPDPLLAIIALDRLFGEAALLTVHVDSYRDPSSRRPQSEIRSADPDFGPESMDCFPVSRGWPTPWRQTCSKTLSMFSADDLADVAFVVAGFEQAVDDGRKDLTGTHP